MPEGPEIRLQADKIAKVVAGQPIKQAVFKPDDLTSYEDIITGRRAERVYCHGKAMLIEFDNGLTMYSHNQLYGVWRTNPKGQLPKTNRQLRVALHTDAGVAALYSATDIALLNNNELAAHPFLCKLGPDVLDPELDAETIAARLADAKFNRRRLASLYLDQGFLAGIGNYLRSEILFDAGLAPRRVANTLTAEETAALAYSTLRICQRAYKLKGVVNDPKRVAAMKAQGLKRSAYRFAAFARAKAPCYRCDARIVREEITARRLYHCPACQR